MVYDSKQESQSFGVKICWLGTKSHAPNNKEGFPANNTRS